MRRLIGIAALVFVAILAWKVGGMLSTDAVGMGVGLIFGVMAGVPAALLVLASGRRRYAEDDEDDSWAMPAGQTGKPYSPTDPWGLRDNHLYPNTVPATAAIIHVPAALDPWQLGMQLGDEESSEERAIEEYLDGYRIATGKEPNNYVRSRAREVLYEAGLLP